MAHGWRIAENFEDWMRTIEKKVVALERRPVVQNSGDIMGPTLGPYVQAVQDCNAAVTAINGYFYVPIGTPNSPDQDLGWMVQTIAQADGYGIQIANREHDSTGGLITGQPATRRFWAPGASVPRIFSSWDLRDTGWIDATYQNGWQSLSGNSAFRLQYRRLNGVVFVRGVVVPTVSWTSMWATLPLGFRPGQDNVRFSAIQGGPDTTTQGDVYYSNGNINCNQAAPTRNGIAVTYLAVNFDFIADG